MSGDRLGRGRRPGWTRPVVAVAAMVLSAGGLAACSSASSAPSGVPDPPGNVSPVPDYPSWCAPSGVDVRSTCLRLALAAVDDARRTEHLGPMAVPAALASMPVAEQLFIAVDEERVARGLPPFVGMSDGLDAVAQRAADRSTLPPVPATDATGDDEWIGGVVNGLDADDEWMYDDGPGSGVPDCGSATTSGCWADRHIVLDDFGGRGQLVMGVGFDGTGDRTPSDRGGTSLAAVFVRTTEPGRLDYTWAQARRALRAGRLSPLAHVPAHESTTGIADPPANVDPVPDYEDICAPSGLDSGPSCMAAVVAAVDRARALEGVRPMVLPADFDQLDVPEQLFVAVDLERVDRGLPPAVGLTAPLDADAAVGARRANDPPFPPQTRYTVSDTEWAGGSVNGLDAVYGWMYQDGYDSGNLDCTRRGAPGCWGHRHGILDDFGPVGVLQMGAAVDPTGDTSTGDRGGTSMTVVLAVDDGSVSHYVYTWAQAVADGAGGVVDSPPSSG